MANPTATRNTKLVRLIAIVLLALIVIVGLTILIIWLAVRPKKLVYSIEDGTIRNYNLTDNNHLNANFNFVLRAYNPNHHVSVYYDRIEATVSYEDEKLAYNTLDPFLQGHRNVTHLRLKLVAQDEALLGAVAKNLKQDRSEGGVELDVRVRAKIRFKVGVWKSGHRNLKITCSPVLVHFSLRRGFDRTFCDVDVK